MSFWQPSFQFLASIFQVFGNLLFRCFLPLRLCLFPAGESTIFASFNHRSGNPTSFRQECLPPETNPQPDESHPCNSFSVSWWIKKRILQTRYVYKIWLESDSIISFSQSSQRKRFNIWMPRSLFCRQTMHSFFSCMHIPCLFPLSQYFLHNHQYLKQLCKKPAQAPQGFPASHFLSSITIKDFPKKCVFASWSDPEKKTDADFNTQSAEFPHEPEKNEKSSKKWKTIRNRKSSFLNVKSFPSLIPDPMRSSMDPETPWRQKVKQNLAK